MELTTKRLLLRPWRLADAESLFRYASDPEVGRAAGWLPHKSVSESLDVIRNVLSGAECYAICEKNGAEAIGAVELMLGGHCVTAGSSDECELGYWLGKPFWGRGYMTEAASETVRHGFEDLNMKTIWCSRFAGNERSKRVQEKLGFVYFRTCKDRHAPLLNEIITEHVSRLTREQYFKAKT